MDNMDEVDKMDINTSLSISSIKSTSLSIIVHLGPLDSVRIVQSHPI